jgi:hypothetical protein
MKGLGTPSAQKTSSIAGSSRTPINGGMNGLSIGGHQLSAVDQPLSESKKKKRKK